MATDFELEPGLTFGEWIFQQIREDTFIEENGFMPDRGERVAARLQTGRAPGDRFVVKVPWLTCFTAFTTPGRYIYFSRRSLERCPDDETVAFVIAHEIAHHDLGHLSIFRGSFARRASRLRAGLLTVLFFRTLQKRIYSPEWELDADKLAIDLCIAAGYDGFKCLRIFQIMERWALDYGDLEMVYGLDPESDDELSAEASLLTKARIWMWQRKRGYLPLQDRGAMARRHLLARLRSGSREHASSPAT